MPGPPNLPSSGFPSRFLPQIPFGLSQGPQGNLVGNTPPPQASIPSQPPVPGYVRQYTQGAGFKRRLPGQVIVAPPALRTFLAPPATLVGLGPVEKVRRRRYLYQTMVAPPVVASAGGPPVPSGTFVGEGAAEHLRRRRFVYPTLVAPPIVAPQGGYPTQPQERYANIASLVAIEHSRRRGSAPLTLILAPPILATTFLAPRATVISNLFRRRGHSVPPSTILPPAVTFTAPVARYANFISLGAAERNRRRHLPGSTILPPPIAGLPIVPRGTFLSQASQRPLTRRNVLRPRLAPPVRTLAGPGATVELQSLRRPYLNRSVPRPHVAAPIVTPVFVAPPATIISQATKRVILHRSGSVLLPPRGSAQPVRPGRFSYQAIQQSYARRQVQKPRLASAIVTPVSAFVAPRALVVSQATKRVVLHRNGSILLPSRGATQPVPLGEFSYQAVQRAQRRSVSKQLRGGPQLPAPTSPPSATYGTYSYQAIERPYTRRQIFPTRVVGPIVTPAPPAPVLAALWASLSIGHAPGPDRRYFRVQKPRLASATLAAARAFVAPPATIVSQANQRATLRRSGDIRLPSLGTPVPVPRGTFVSQAQRRPYVGRSPLRPRVAPAIVGPARFLAPPALVLSQAVRRSVLRRSGGVRLASRGALPPVPSGTFTTQALKRPYVGRSPLRPRVAPPLVFVAPFLAPSALIVTQATKRGWQSRLRTTPRPHLALPVSTSAGPGATVHLQAVTGRALLGRQGHVRLPALGSPVPVPRGTFTSQALRRPYVRRSTPAPRLARPIIPPPIVPPNAPGTFIFQAAKRSVWLGSRGGRVHHASPVLRPGHVQATIVSQAVQRPLTRRGTFRLNVRYLAPQAGPGATLKLQAVQRPSTRRSVPLRPRLAKALIKPPPAPITTSPILVLQAIERAYLGRKVPPSPSLRYHPITFVPSQPGVPFPSITATGVTGPTFSVATTRPGANVSETNPLGKEGLTGGYGNAAVTNPESKESS